jgi:hypothetical protein
VFVYSIDRSIELIEMIDHLHFSGLAGAWRGALATHIFVAYVRGYVGINTKNWTFFLGRVSRHLGYIFFGTD